jgi:hypothetical protein
VLIVAAIIRLTSPETVSTEDRHLRLLHPQRITVEGQLGA